MTTCPICVDDYDKTIKKVACHFCAYDTCVGCAQQYLLGTPELPHCMNCRKGWSREFLIDQLSLSFVMKEYKVHRENVLFEKEKSLLPATQPFAERELVIRRKQKEIDDAKTEMEQFEATFFDTEPKLSQIHQEKTRIFEEVTKVMPATYRHSRFSADIFMEMNLIARVCDGLFYVVCGRTIQENYCNRCHKNVCIQCHRTYVGKFHMCDREDLEKEQTRKKLIAEYKTLKESEDGHEYAKKVIELEDGKLERIRTIHRIKRSINQVPRVPVPRQRAGEDGAGPSSSTSEKTTTFIRACPANECRGFLSTAWKCGLCNIFVCSKCHEIKGSKKDTPHECDPANIETARLLDKEAKPCPNCAALICKVKGCDQMWCTQCQTAFSWNTGKIVKDGPIHNPHYFEYMRNHGQQRREIDDIPCGGLPYNREIQQSLTRFFEPSDETAQLIQAYFRVTGEIMDLRRWYRDRHLEDNRNARVKYLVKDYDDKRLKQVLHTRAKAAEKVQNIDQILDMFVMVSSTIFQRFVVADKVEDIVTIPDELRELRRYTNESMKKISEVYQCKTPSIDEEVVLHRVGERRG